MDILRDEFVKFKFDNERCSAMTEREKINYIESLIRYLNTVTDAANAFKNMLLEIVDAKDSI